jgi:hypothetical protein
MKVPADDHPQARQQRPVDHVWPHGDNLTLHVLLMHVD